MTEKPSTADDESQNHEVLTDGGENDAKVIGKTSDTDGVGIYGEASGSGDTYGVWGQASNGYGIGTSGDAKIDGTLIGDTIQATSGNGVTINTDSGSRTLELGVPTSDGSREAGGNVVAGHPNNTVNNSAVGVVIGGGGAANDNENTASGDYATIAGGFSNTATDTNATVGGGQGNDAKGFSATVGGGQGNIASGDNSTIAGGSNNDTNANNATVSGGNNNIANALNAAVCGGKNNAVSGDASVVASGSNNTASGNFSNVGGGGANTASGVTAAVPGGLRGAAEDDNAFVWNDGTGYHAIPNAGSDGLSSSTAIDGESVTGTNTFHASAADGFRFITGGSSSPNVTYIASDGTLALAGLLDVGSNAIQSGSGEPLTFNTDGGSRALKLGVPTSDGVQTAGGNVVAGHPNNTVNNSAVGVVIGGGGAESIGANTVGGNYATVAGGFNNEAKSTYATVSGGKDNIASDYSATVPGGVNNVADGSGSIACGEDAGAFDGDAFVWNDGYHYHSYDSINRGGLSSSKAVDGESVTGSNTFSASAEDGFRFITGANNAAGPSVVTLDGDGSAELTFHSDLPSEDATAVNINSNGTLVKATSSARYKTNIQPLSTDTSAVLDLEPKAFEYEDSGQQSTGLIAEDVDEVLPDLVHYGDEGRPESVNYDRVGVYLVPEVEENRDRLDDVEEATADHGATIETLEATLDAKDQRIEDQQDRIDRLESRVEQKDDRIEDLETETDELRIKKESLRERVAAIEAELGIDTGTQAVADD